ncbi:hypothetical protein ACR9E3_09235 [Actinomycetospora sp. C-140]
MSDQPPDRSVDIALAEYNALRAELLGHTTSQNTVLGLGVTAIGVVLGLGVNAPGQRAILVVVPALAAIVLLVYWALAYRIVVIGNYTRLILWPSLAAAAPSTMPLSWEQSLANLESGGRHRWLRQIVEYAVTVLLIVLGGYAIYLADGPFWPLRGAGVVILVLATGGGILLGGRRTYTVEEFNRQKRAS